VYFTFWTNGPVDCLTLNVWKPTNASAGDALPVAVYIHVRYSTRMGAPQHRITAITRAAVFLPVYVVHSKR
jgi:carboxylesterase type B